MIQRSSSFRFPTFNLQVWSSGASLELAPGAGLKWMCDWHGPNCWSHISIFVFYPPGPRAAHQLKSARQNQFISLFLLFLWCGCHTCLDRWCCLWPLHIAKRLMRCCTDTGCYFTYWNMAKHISMVNCGGEPRVQQQHSGLCRAMQKSGPVQNKLHNLVLSSHTVQIMWLVHTCSREHGNMWVISTPHSTLTRNAMGHRLLYLSAKQTWKSWCCWSVSQCQCWK